MKGNNQRGFTLLEALTSVVVIVVIVAIIFAIWFGPRLLLVRQDAAVTAIEHAGYRDVQVTKYFFGVSWRGCGNDDTVKFEGTAVNSKDERVPIVACGSIWKDITVRNK